MGLVRKASRYMLLADYTWSQQYARPSRKIGAVYFIQAMKLSYVYLSLFSVLLRLFFELFQFKIESNFVLVGLGMASAAPAYFATSEKSVARRLRAEKIIPEYKKLSPGRQSRLRWISFWSLIISAGFMFFVVIKSIGGYKFF